MIRIITEGITREKSALLIQELASLLSIRTIKQRELELIQGVDLFAAIDLGVEIHQKGRAKQNTSFQFIFTQQLPQSPWRLQDLFIK
jgi:hypothetical protein